MQHLDNWTVRSLAILCLGMIGIQAGALSSAPDELEPGDFHDGLCKRITQCDKRVAENHNFMADCPAFFGRAEKYPDAASDMAQCVKDSKCEGFEFQSCLDTYSTALRKKSQNSKDHDDIVRGSIVGAFGGLWAWEMPKVSGEQLKRFESHCKNLVSCDAELSVHDDPVRTCVGYLSGIYNRLPLSLENFEKCVSAPECGEGRFTQCMARVGQEMSTGPQKYEPPGAPPEKRKGTPLVSSIPSERIVRARIPTDIGEDAFYKLKFSPDHSAEATGWKFVYVPSTHQWFCLGLRSGDIIRRINEQPVGRTYGSLQPMYIGVAKSIKSVTIQRGAALIKFNYQHDKNSENDCGSQKRDLDVAKLNVRQSVCAN